MFAKARRCPEVLRGCYETFRLSFGKGIFNYISTNPTVIVYNMGFKVLMNEAAVISVRL